MISETAIQHLIDTLGAANILHEKEDLLTFGYDATPELQRLPDVVTFPTTTEQVVALVNFARN